MEKSKTANIVRFVLVAVLLIFVALKIFDLNARSKAQQTYSAVSELLESKETANDGTITQAEIHERFGPPTEGYSSGDNVWIDAYKHRGAFRSYAALVEYSDRVEKLVVGVSTK